MSLSASKQLPAGLPEVLRAAHDVFINLTTDRILQIEALTVAINKGEDPEPAAREIAQIAHKIAGVAGSGNPRVSRHRRSGALGRAEPQGGYPGRCAAAELEQHQPGDRGSAGRDGRGHLTGITGRRAMWRGREVSDRRDRSLSRALGVVNP